MKIWIYRPDRGFHPNVNPECVYDLNGVPYVKKRDDEASLARALREKYIHEVMYPQKNKHYLEG